MKLLKNKIVIGILCIVLALVFSFVALPALIGGSQSETTSVFRMKQSVTAGTQITADMLENISIPENVAENVLKDKASIVGQYAASDLYAGDYLSAEKLTATLAEQSLFSAGEAKGKTVVSVTLPSLASGVSGRLLPGDIVTVIAIPQGSVNQDAGRRTGKQHRNHRIRCIHRSGIGIHRGMHGHDEQRRGCQC